MKFKATVTLSTLSGHSINKRSLEVIEYLKQHHCSVSAIEETKVIRGHSTFYRHKVRFEDGIKMIHYSNLPEVLENMQNMEFISIEVVK